LSPFPGPNSVIILDNVAFHRYRPFVTLMEMIGVLLVYLPPYTPHMNVIELLFGIIKAAIRRLGPGFASDIVLNTVRILEFYKDIDYRPAIRRIGYFDYMQH